MTLEKRTLLNVKTVKSISNGIGNTFQKQYWYRYQQYFCQSIVIGIDNSFHNVVNISAADHVTAWLTLLNQWRIQDFCEGDAAGVWGQSPQWGPGAESLVGDLWAKPPPPEKLSTFCDTTNNLISNFVAGT